MTRRFRIFCLARSGPVALCLAALGLVSLNSVFSPPLAAQSAQNRITAPLDETHLVRLHGNIHPLAQPRFDQGPAPLSMPTGRVALILRRSSAQQQALTQYLADVQNPASPSFHRWLTPTQYGDLYGLSDSDIATVQSWLQSHGFQIDKLPQARNFIEFSGSIDQLQTAFRTSIHTFSVRGQMHYANITDPEIPAALAPVVAGISPLNDFHPHPNLQPPVLAHYDSYSRTIQPGLTLYSANNANDLFVDPADAATIYDAPNPALNPAYSGTTWTGAGVSIGILGTSGLTLADIANYRTAFLGETSTSVNLPTVVVDGNDPGLVPGTAADEALLDNEIAGALAPQAKLIYYTSANTNLSAGLMNAYIRALDENRVAILSVSFSGCEAEQGSGGNQAIFEAAQQAAAQGISVVVSAGDGGSAGCDNFNTAAAAQDGLAVNGLASTPYTIAVGGTDFDVLTSAFSTYVNTSSGAPYYRTALGYIPEEPWNQSTSVNTSTANNVAFRSGGNQTNIIAGGGGPSTCVTQSSTGTCLAGYAKPAFQTSLTPPDGVRDLPDVSLFSSAGFSGAYWVFCSDSASDGSTGSSYTGCLNNRGAFTPTTTFGGVGGTSASAPAFAGMLALVAQSQNGARLGQADTILYQLARSTPTVFHDIATGDNAVPCASGSPNCGSNGFLTGYNAHTGYDRASGLGSVDLAALIANWNSVALSATAASLTINGSAAPYTGTHGATLTFNTGVNPTSATGLVAIADTAGQSTGASENDFTIPLKSGAGSATWNGLPGGSYTVSARYAGDTANAASTSNSINITIAPESSTATLSIQTVNPLTGALISNLNAIPYGSAVILDAQITGTAEGAKTQGHATGSVTFTDGGATLASAQVDSQNTASWPPLSGSFAALAAGAHVVVARYSGDSSFKPGNSSPVVLTVLKAGTSIAATSTGTVTDTSASTVTVTLTTPWNPGLAPSGTVTLSANGYTLATLSSLTQSAQGSGAGEMYVLSGSTPIGANHLNTGNNIVTVTYGGDSNYTGAATTLALNVAVSTAAPGPAIAIGNSGNINLTRGAATGNTSTLTITPSGGFSGKVNLTCSVTATVTNANDLPACALPSSVSITGNAPTTATLTVNTTAPVASALNLPRFFDAGVVALALILFFGIPARRRGGRALFMALAAIVAVSAIGCAAGGSKSTATQPAGSTSPGTTPGSYTVVVSAADAATGTVTASTAITVTVN